jgi:fumarate reductase subunit D
MPRVNIPISGPAVIPVTLMVSGKISPKFSINNTRVVEMIPFIATIIFKMFVTVLSVISLFTNLLIKSW